MTFDMFVEGTKPKQSDRQYVTLIDFPAMITNGPEIFVKRVRLVIDVTDRGLSPDASQFEFEMWLEKDQGRFEEFMQSVIRVVEELKQDPTIRQEAREFIASLGRTIR